MNEEMSPEPEIELELFVSPKKRTTRRQFLLRNGALLGAVAAGECMREAGNIEITRHQVPLVGLRYGLRVVQLSDFHRSWCVSEDYIARIVRQTNLLEPDIIALTGDFVTRSSEYMASCAKQLSKLKAPMGMYAVLGNHDHWCDNNMGAQHIAAELDAIKVKLLVNSNVRLRNGLRIVGVEDSGSSNPDPPAAFEGILPGEPVLALTHNPGVFNALRDYDCVTLAGHTHGGQIYCPVVSEDLLSWHTKYLRGWYHSPKYPGRLYVSRGLGVIHIPVRFNARPEISVFEFVPA